MPLRNSLTFVFLVIFAASGCAPIGAASDGHIRDPAPALSLTTLDGRRISTSELLGKVVVLDFWATWCPPCRQALPHLQALSGDADRAKRGLVVLAVNEGEDRETARTFLEDNHFTFTVLLDPSGSAGRAYWASTLPQTVVIGRDGLVEAVISGWTPDTAHQIDQAVADALDAPIR